MPVRALEVDRIMNTNCLSTGRAIVQVHGHRDPAHARERWERHIACLRNLPEPSPMQLADLANGRERLTGLKSGAV